MGSDQSNKNELEAACLSRADIYVPDRLSQCRKMGELRAAIEAGAVKDDQQFAELGDLLVRDTPARANSNQITIADLTGMGIQDTAIATLALTALRKESVVT
jgi:ornithine cyclodeaminase